MTITIATGVLLWNKNDGTVCTAPNSYDDFKKPGEWYDVSRRFRDILKIFFALAITDFWRCNIMIAAVWL